MKPCENVMRISSVGLMALLVLTTSCQSKGKTVIDQNAGYVKAWHDALEVLDTYDGLRWKPCVMDTPYKFERCYFHPKQDLPRTGTHHDLTGQWKAKGFTVSGNLGEGDVALRREDLGEKGRILLMNADGEISMELYTGNGRAKAANGEEWHKNLHEAAQELAGIVARVYETQDRQITCPNGVADSYCVASTKTIQQLVDNVKTELYNGSPDSFEQRYAKGPFTYHGEEWSDVSGPYLMQLLSKSPVQFNFIDDRFERIEFNLQFLPPPKGVTLPAGTKTLVQVKAAWRPGMKPALAD